jgi:hypothetical protein
MTRTHLLAATLAVALSMPTSTGHAQQMETMRVPVFGTVTIYRGAGPPRQVVLFIFWRRRVEPWRDRHGRPVA